MTAGYCSLAFALRLIMSLQTSEITGRSSGVLCRHNSTNSFSDNGVNDWRYFYLLSTSVRAVIEPSGT